MEFAVLPDLHWGRTIRIINWWDGLILRGDVVLGLALETRLRQFVESVNLSAAKFVISVGDLTDSGDQTQFAGLQKILADLRVPWVPILGNHDVWPYSRDPESGKVLCNATGPIDFVVFKSSFSKEFVNATRFFKDWQEQGDTYCNFAFSFRGLRFIVVDNVNRNRSWFGLPGVVPWSQLYPESQQWLKDQLEQTTHEAFAVVSHTPLNESILGHLVYNRQILTIAGHFHRFRVKSNRQMISLIANALYSDRFYPAVKYEGQTLVQVRSLPKETA